MANVKYQLRYLPIFYEDMAEVVDNTISRRFVRAVIFFGLYDQ